jgi:two-component system chemotaxis response regulator CheB
LKSEGPISVLPVQASPLFHTLASGVLCRHRDINVLPGAGDVAELRERILDHHPDVVLFDLALPEAAAAELLRSLREYCSVPIIACSGSGNGDAQRALAVIEQGVLDIVVKPCGSGAEPVHRLGEELAQKIRTAVDEARPVPPPQSAKARAAGLSFRAAGVCPDRHLIVMGASTGGTEALRTLLMHMPSDSPTVAIVQHMPALFTRAFAERLNLSSPLQVSEAVAGDRLTAGRAVVARGDTHLAVWRNPGGWVARYTHQRLVNRHCPSVDELFGSAVKAAGKNAVGILLTGMGHDGARGLLRLRQAGALTVAQDAESCVVFGMPKAAQQLGAAELTGPPEAIPRLVIQALASRRHRSASGAVPSAH